MITCRPAELEDAARNRRKRCRKADLCSNLAGTASFAVRGYECERNPFGFEALTCTERAAEYFVPN